MARKNRKKSEQGFLFPVPLTVILLAVTLLALFHICLKARADALGREIKALEARRVVLRDQLKKVEGDWSLLRSPARVEAALREHGLVMAWPRRDQIVRIICAPASGRVRRLEPTQPLQYAQIQKVVMND